MDKLQRLTKKVAEAVKEEERDKAGHLHNAITACLKEQEPEIETVLYVLEMVKWELLKQRFTTLFKEA